ncbi:acetyl-CoA carboxylase, biotin carboxyl carrier protein [Novibacillus thermophilus]|uniref:Biotin carboxyl carrier protein of acetyl-CoA carboxylase n=2 Tax=Novibacillus thermophilus TaxID=1471761 RepID=A0A1U9K976_9BACL|nr:acetyl-CoA carboxylase, biotin carboxyl carrier protein [Novibacillus thermophilus]
MKMEDIRELIQIMEQSDLEELELEQHGVRLSLKKSLSPGDKRQPNGEAVQTKAVQHVSEATDRPEHDTRQTATEDTSLHKIVSPMVGTFYRAPAPDADPYVQVGDRVQENTVVCIVEAMKLMNEIEAEVTGEIVEVLAENGQLVEYGQPLFLVKKD